MSIKSPTGRLARWALTVQSFDIKIEYLPGKRNVLADMLSRPPCPHEADETCDVCSFIVDFLTRSAEDIRTQLEDPDLKKIIDSFEDEGNDDNAKWTARGYIMSSGVLYKYYADDDTEEAQLVVPTHETEYYENIIMCRHYGTERTPTRKSLNVISSPE